MKTKLIVLTLTGLFIASCSSKKTAAVPEKPKEVVLTPELIEGKNLYGASCVKCHKLYEPKAYSKEEWTPILVRMQKKARLDDVKMASITNYIHSQL